MHIHTHSVEELATRGWAERPTDILMNYINYYIYIYNNH